MRSHLTYLSQHPPTHPPTRPPIHPRTPPPTRPHTCQQEKNRLLTDLRRLRDHYAKYEPTILELKRKFEAALREKMLLALERDRMRTKVRALGPGWGVWVGRGGGVWGGATGGELGAAT